MGSKRYGEEMSKIVRFTPKGQTTMDDIYSQYDKAGQRHSGIPEENTTKETFGAEKFYLRPTDRDYGDSKDFIKSKKRKAKAIAKAKVEVSEEKLKERRKKPSVKKESPSKSSKNVKDPKAVKENKVVKDPETSKVVEKERRKAILESIKPTKDHKRVAVIAAAMAVMLVMFISFFFVSSKITSVKYENLELKKQYETKKYEKKELETKLESSNRSELIESVAREQLGMNYPRPDQIVYIKSN